MQRRQQEFQSPSPSIFRSTSPPYKFGVSKDVPKEADYTQGVRPLERRNEVVSGAKPAVVGGYIRK
ncbi:13058_t:CDS:2, partial [Gigaspora rosea]